jgi:hypothetical protein
VLILVAAYFVALVAIFSQFKSTNSITNDGKIETVGPSGSDLAFGGIEFIIVSAIAIIVYRNCIM